MTGLVLSIFQANRRDKGPSPKTRKPTPDSVLWRPSARLSWPRSHAGAASVAGFDVDVEHPLQTLRPELCRGLSEEVPLGRAQAMTALRFVG